MDEYESDQHTTTQPSQALRRPAAPLVSRRSTGRPHRRVGAPMTSDPTTTAAHNAERELWHHYGLAVDERFIDIDDPRLRVRMLECGTPSGQPLVFVAGGLGEAWGWAGLMAKLTEFRCVTLDRPGGGLSDGVDFLAVNVRKLAVDVLGAVVDAAGVTQAVFVANSMGGWWTFQFAMRAPSRVSRMVMLGCPADILETSAPLPMRLVAVPVLGRGLVKLMRPRSPAKARNQPRFLGHPAQVGHQWPGVQAETAYRFGQLPDVQRSSLTLLRRFLRPGGTNPSMRISAGELHSVTQPTLLIWGRNDPFGTPEDGRAAAQLMPQARFELVGLGHLPWWDEPDQCARLIREFVPPAAR